MNQVDHIDLSDEGVDAILAAIDTAGLTVHHHETDGDHINLRLNPLAEYGAIVLSWRADEQGWLLAEYGEQGETLLLWYLGYIGMDNAITRTAVILADDEQADTDEPVAVDEPDAETATADAPMLDQRIAELRAALAHHNELRAAARAELDRIETTCRILSRTLADLEQDASQPAPTTHTVETDVQRVAVVTSQEHDAQCRWRVASPQDTTPVVLHCAGCGLAYPAAASKDGAR